MLVHGLALSSLYLAPTAERLAPDFRVFAPELPGFGQSEQPQEPLDIPALAAALRAGLDAFSLDRAAVVGHSFGCQVAVELAQQQPERVSQLVLADPAIDPGARTSWQQIKRFLRELLREPPSYVAMLARDFTCAGPWRTWRTLQFMLRYHLEEKLPRVRAPTLVVRGSRDTVVCQGWAEAAAERLPNGRLAVIAGAPHAVPYAAAQEFACLVRAFLRGEETRPFPHPLETR